ncbi:MAG: shikimate kinase [Acidobacteria bacterium]|nr:shikimate kinase [Acidobacteriota bacterium]MBK8812086.1 shikimate kinase [Acidobacteriota bacterium]
MAEEIRIVLTGFMGVGKSTVARHLASMLGCDKTDLDAAIADRERKSIANIIDEHGIDEFRRIESEVLGAILESGARIVALGGGAWTVPANRRLIKDRKFTSIWLETSFDHCWLNIVNSKRVRPLARNKAETFRLFEERQKLYCLADWHFVVRSGLNSFEVARQIAEEVFSLEFD